MKIKDLVNALSEHGYKIAKIQGDDYTFLCKTNEEEVPTIVIIDDIMYPKLADPEQCATISKAFENTFLLRGYRRVNTLFLILTDKPYGFKNFSDGSFLFWVADLYSERLISFMENDTAFDSVRSSIEETLVFDKNYDVNILFTKDNKVGGWQIILPDGNVKNQVYPLYR